MVEEQEDKEVRAFIPFQTMRGVATEGHLLDEEDPSLQQVALPSTATREEQGRTRNKPIF